MNITSLAGMGDVGTTGSIVINSLEESKGKYHSSRRFGREIGRDFSQQRAAFSIKFSANQQRESLSRQNEPRRDERS